MYAHVYTYFHPLDVEIRVRQQVFYAVASEHLLLFLKVLADSRVEVSEDLELACNKKKYEKFLILDKFDTGDPEEVSVSYQCVFCECER